MPIIYVISSIAIFVLTILVKKSKEKLEITKSIVITSTMQLAYNALVCWILNLINIPITVVSLTITNIITTLVLSICIIKKKETQKYYFSKTNALISVIFILLTIVIIGTTYGNFTRIRYVSMDSREHYKAAREFSENTQLTNKATENNTTNPAFMIMGYTNVGIIFKVLNPYIGTMQLYKAYILFEAFVYLLTGLMFYMILQKDHYKIKEKIIITVLSLIYLIGYPLNAWISGFHYLVLGILYIEAIIYVFKRDVKLNEKYSILLLFLLNFGLIFSYSLFCPFVYLAEFIYIIYMFKKEKKRILLYTLFTLVLPGIIGVSYLIIPSLGKVSGYINLEGWVYKNLWSNFILFVPFAIYEIYAGVKEKKFKFYYVLFFTLIIYMLVLFIGTKIGRCSEYYFYKNYFIMWLMIICLSTKGLIRYLNEQKDKFVIKTFIIFYLIFMGISVYFGKAYIKDKPTDNITDIMQVYVFNKTMMIAKNSAFINNQEIDLLSKAEEIIKDNWKKENLLIITNPTQGQWIQSLTGYYDILYNDKKNTINKMNNNDFKYVIAFENREMFKKYGKEIDLDNMQILYENDLGKIYIKK